MPQLQPSAGVEHFSLPVPSAKKKSETKKKKKNF